MILYHVTREMVLLSITEHGIDPKYATGKMRACWFVEESEVLWALAHVSVRWELPVSRLYVLQMQVSIDQMYRWMIKGIWYSFNPLRHEAIWGYERFIKQEALPRA